MRCESLCGRGKSVVILLMLTTGLVAGPAAVAQQPTVSLDFDMTGPTITDDLPMFFDFLGWEPDIITNWTVDPNLVDPANGTNALHTVSDGNQLRPYFSRVAILKAAIFKAEDAEISADITWDDLSGDATDNAGLYLRFNGNSDVPDENDYYHVRIGVDNGPPSSVNVHRVKDGIHELLHRAVDDPFPISTGETHTLTFRAVTVANAVELFVSVDGQMVFGIDPFVDDIDPLLGPGRAGVGQETNPTYFDNITLTNLRITPGPKFVRGDTDSNGKVELTDGIVTLTFLFVDANTKPACFDAADTDDDGALSITDGIRIFQWLFIDPTQIPLPPSPQPGLAVYAKQDCGEDPNAEDPELGCETLSVTCQ